MLFRSPHEIPWCKPTSGTYKLNVDACFFPNGTGALGVVIRNDKGEPIAGAGDPSMKVGKVQEIR